MGLRKVSERTEFPSGANFVPLLYKNGTKVQRDVWFSEKYRNSSLECRLKQSCTYLAKIF